MSITTTEFYPDFGPEDIPAPVEAPLRRNTQEQYNFAEYVRTLMQGEVEVEAPTTPEEKVQGMIDHIEECWTNPKTELMHPYYFATMDPIHALEAKLLHTALTEKLGTYGVIREFTNSVRDSEKQRLNVSSIYVAGGKAFKVTTQYMIAMQAGHVETSTEIGQTIGMPTAADIKQ